MADLTVIDQLKGEIAAIETGGKGCPSRPKQSNRETGGSAFDKIVALLNVSDRSEKSLRDRLAKADFSDDEINEAVKRAERCGLIDDLRFADALIRSRLRQGRGAAGIERELREHDIDVDLVAGWPHEFGVNDESEYQRALDLLRAHPSRSKNRRDGAYRKLIQKGFASSIASSAARTWAESF